MHSTSGPILIPASLSIDPAALARLGASPQADVTALLKDVRDLLADVRERLVDNRLAVGGDEAAAMLGVSAKTLRTLPIPSVSTAVGGRRVWPIAALRKFIDDHAAVYTPATEDSR